MIHAGSLGYVYALLGRAAESIPLLEDTLSAMERMRSRFALSLYLARLSEAYLLADRLDRLEDALALAWRALSLAREGSQRNAEARTLRLLGDVTARGNSPEQAESHYRDARALAEELGMRPLAAHCRAGLGRLFERTGKQEESRQHLTTATTMYREMEMTYWLEKLAPPGRS
jgi:tetratricopeptide (TPR) repeat protein